jgi:hypothetical protein
MNLPGFTAETSLYRSGHHYRSRNSMVSQDLVVPAFPWDSPQINVRYQPPQPPFGRGFPGTLTITGTNFSPNEDLLLTITNCASGGIPCRTGAHTTKSFSYCNRWDCRFYFGGEFHQTVPIFCGGDTTVTVQDPAGNVIATGTTSLPC